MQGWLINHWRPPGAVHPGPPTLTRNDNRLLTALCKSSCNGYLLNRRRGRYTPAQWAAQNGVLTKKNRTVTVEIFCNWACHADSVSRWAKVSDFLKGEIQKLSKRDGMYSSFPLHQSRHRSICIVPSTVKANREIALHTTYSLAQYRPTSTHVLWFHFLPVWDDKSQCCVRGLRER